MATAAHPERARIYVSFADEDRARAMEVVRWLNDSGWQVAADDRHAFASDDRWSPPERLEACDVILCVITPGWLVSVFCHHEFSYCAKRGKFILPVICEPLDVGMLPQALRALPRVDLTQNRLTDYLTLKDTLSQTGSKVGRVATVEDKGAPESAPSSALYDHRWLSLWLAVVIVASVVVFWLWAHY